MTAPTDESGPEQGRYLLCSRKDGIGARLNNLVWTWRLARSANLRTLCFWPPLDPYYGESYGAGDLLDVYSLTTSALRHELKIVDGRPFDFIHPKVVRLEAGERHDPNAYAVIPKAVRSSKHGPVPLIDSGIGPVLQPGEDPEAATLEARALFARLPLNLRILQHLKHAEKSYGLKRMVAVHVRGGDILEVLRDACANFTPEDLAPGSVLDRYTEHFFRGCASPPSYVRLVRRYLTEGYGILFFSDTPGAAHPFQKRFPYKLMTAESLPTPQLTGIQRALFEILLMSRCHAIIGAKSMFSNLASLIGGAPLVDARRETTPEEFMRVYKRAVRFDSLAPEIRAGISQVLVRKLEENRLLDLWGTGGEDILRLLAAA